MTDLMKDVVSADEFAIESFLDNAVYTYLLVAPHAKFIYMSALAFGVEYQMKIDIYKNSINIKNDKYRILGDYLAVKPKAHKQLKEFVKGQILRYIEPADYPPKTKVTAKHFRDRMLTQKSYDEKSKNLINSLVNKITHLSVTPPDECKQQVMQKFRSYTQQWDAANVWKRFISDLVNGKIRTGDDTSDYFNSNIKNFIALLNENDLPSLVEIQNDNVIVSPLYEKNNLSIAPYIISAMDTGMAKSYLTDIALYSCFRGK